MVVSRGVKSIGRFLLDAWPLWSTVSMAALAWFSPQGVVLYDVLLPFLIAVLFLLVGLGTDLDKVWEGAAACKVHVLMQGFMLLVAPLAYYGLVFRWGWAVSAGFLTPYLSIGTMILAAMPTTAATSLVFVQQVKGDAICAALNMALSQLVAALVAPAMVTWLLSQKEVPTANLGHTLLMTSVEIVLPLLLGVVAHASVKKRCDFDVARSRRGSYVLKSVSVLALLVLFYLIFAKTFSAEMTSSDKVDLSLWVVTKLLLWMLVVHLFFILLAGALSVGAQLSPSQRRAFLFVAPQKTEGLTMAVVTAMFGHSSDMPIAQLVLPSVAYHCIQILVGSLMVPIFKRSACQPDDSLPHYSDRALLGVPPATGAATCSAPAPASASTSTSARSVAAT